MLFYNIRVFFSNRELICYDERKSQNKISSSEYIVICQDELYIVSTIPQEILHILQDKYKINIHLQG